MLTNTYTPFVGGVPRSVKTFRDQYREMGHRTLVIAPEFEDAPDDEEDVIRLPAIKDVSDAGFSVRIPIPGYLSSKLDEVEPDIVHAHHPFLLGDTALRIARRQKLPLVFTHHTLYEQYTHYLPVDPPAVDEYVVNLVSGYCNLCDEVFAPSESVRDLLQKRGVETPIDVVPTGVDVDAYGSGDGKQFRRDRGIPRDSYVVGHVGRLAEEKNLGFLADTMAEFLEDHSDVYFLVVGVGPAEDDLVSVFEGTEYSDRFRHAGVLEGDRLYDAYASMDCFAFTSTTETQGMVLVEAMCSGTPVVALDASGSRDVVVDGETGFLVDDESVSAFVKALEDVYGTEGSEREELESRVRKRAREFSEERTARNALEIYSKLVEEYEETERDDTLWSQAKRRLDAEWEILGNLASATDAVILNENEDFLSRWRGEFRGEHSENDVYDD
jgi:glycosyltransferase involved in cell wall biosynthesis